jgi:hypothetical protein
MSRPTQWADTLPDGRWVPTMIDVHDHNTRAWDFLSREGKRTRRVVIVSSEGGPDWVLWLAVLLAFIAGLLTAALLRC